jgi:hypothetical protein
VLLLGEKDWVYNAIHVVRACYDTLLKKPTSFFKGLITAPLSVLKTEFVPELDTALEDVEKQVKADAEYEASMKRLRQMTLRQEVKDAKSLSDEYVNDEEDDGVDPTEDAGNEDDGDEGTENKAAGEEDDEGEDNDA